MTATFPLESNLFYLDLDAQFEPMVLRTRATDGSVQTVELADRVLWSAQNVKCRITTSAELQTFQSFFFANKSTSFLIYDPTNSNVYLEDVGTGDGSENEFTLYHTYPTSGTLLVYVDGVLKTETTDYTVNYTTGVITFLTPPASSKAVTATYRFRRLAIFDGGFTWRKRSNPDGATVTSAQNHIITFSLLESI